MAEGDYKEPQDAKEADKDEKQIMDGGTYKGNEVSIWDKEKETWRHGVR